MRADVAAALELLEATATTARGRLRVDPAHPVFAGHFPGQPVVPGVLLLEAVRALVERATGARLAIAAVRDARFTARAEPGDEVELRVSWTPGSVVPVEGMLYRGPVAIAAIRLELAGAGS